MSRYGMLAGCTLVLAIAGVPAIAGATKGPTLAEGKKLVSAVTPKTLSSHVNLGLAWLAKHQLENGAWGQGDESQEMGVGAELSRKPIIGDTCAAALAFIRAGHTPAKGEYKEVVRRAVVYICSQVEKSPPNTLAITNVTGTRLQAKLGPNIDTFLASLLLAEVKGQMGNPKDEKRVAAEFHRIADKIEMNQKKDGTLDKEGWAPALSQVIAAKALNRGAQNGLKVSEKSRQLAETYGRKQFDSKGGGFGAGGSAGVDLYASAGSLGAMQQSDNTNSVLELEYRNNLKTAKNEPAKRQAQAQLDRIAANRKDLEGARKAVVKKMDDPAFVAGFGSNGGEEFLSHMNIGESLVVKGGPEWKKWDEQMTKNMDRIQNPDGSWSGHHCITGRTFCTAAALMVLTVDRSPVPLAQKISRK